MVCVAALCAVGAANPQADTIVRESPSLKGDISKTTGKYVARYEVYENKKNLEKISI